MKNILLLSCFAFIHLLAYSQLSIFDMYLPDDELANVTEKTVSSVKPQFCTFDNVDGFYPVLFEEFNYPCDLPNIWSFKLLGSPYDLSGTNYYPSHVNDGPYVSGNLNYHNASFNNGILTMTTNQENFTGGSETFTSFALSSLMKFKTGKFEGHIKIPAADRMWPAFWLLNNAGHYGEWDIFEFYDNTVPNPLLGDCDHYHEHTSSLHVGNTTIDAHRSTRVDGGDLSNSFHTYKLIWTEYEAYVMIDGQIVGFASKYFKRSMVSAIWRFDKSCAMKRIPNQSFSCQSLQNLPEWIVPPTEITITQPWWWPGVLSWIGDYTITAPGIPYSVDEQGYFPDNNSQMQLILNSQPNPKYLSTRFLDFYSQDQMNMQVDWIKVSQPFSCSNSTQIYTFDDLGNSTHNTYFLSGDHIKIGDETNNSANFLHQIPGDYPGSDNDWKENPIVIVATEDIKINSEAIFEGQQYVKLATTDCSNLVGRMNDTEQSQIQIFQDQQNLDILNYTINYQNTYFDEITQMEYARLQAQYVDNTNRSYMIKKSSEVVDVYPIPTNDFLLIDASETTMDKINIFFLLDVNGKQILETKDQKIDMTEFEDGVYYLKIMYLDGSEEMKKVLKQ